MTVHYFDSDAARTELIRRLRSAPEGSICDVGGYDAIKQPQGSWLVEPDDDMDVPVGLHSAALLASYMCCYHSAHWPSE